MNLCPRFRRGERHYQSRDKCGKFVREYAGKRACTDRSARTWIEVESGELASQIWNTIAGTRLRVMSTERSHGAERGKHETAGLYSCNVGVPGSATLLDTIARRCC